MRWHIYKLQDVACNVRTAGSKHQVVTLCDALYQFYGAVCTGVLLLAKAGVIKGKSATTHWLAMEELKYLGSHPVSERVV
ncbi:DJ-1/PfpI family protein [Okeania sp. SIO2C9]|uniref:DJ-1/PfpI family protein n=1 Tax=Okeania sp. SIO2C9 TaxID=2607791 RepID=UPI0025F5DC06|nr:DJ-1/PfpI family protein [Okeania sp. SIO2C9]